jgi:lysophospholipid acyltransferase (LPLAT)-like uncharacterized protein
LFRKYFLSFIVWIFYRVLSWTWTVSVEEPLAMRDFIRRKTPIILAHWHGDEIPLVSLVQRYRIATMISTSKDGEMMNTVVRLMGGTSARGSSTRGGSSALKGLIRIMKSESRNTSLAVDGPKGPIYIVKPGVFELSRLIENPIFSAGVYCDSKMIIEKAWNKAYLPKPFAKINIVWRGPVGPVTRNVDPRSEALREELTAALLEARQSAVKEIAGPASLS